MADQKQQDTQKQSDKAVEKSATITCDLFNPTPARRIIYDGIEGSQKQIVVGSKETKRGVVLSRQIAEELRDRNRAKKDSDLVIKPQSSSEPMEDKDEKTAA